MLRNLYCTHPTRKRTNRLKVGSTREEISQSEQSLSTWARGDLKYSLPSQNSRKSMQTAHVIGRLKEECLWISENSQYRIS